LEFLSECFLILEFLSEFFLSFFSEFGFVWIFSEFFPSFSYVRPSGPVRKARAAAGFCVLRRAWPWRIRAQHSCLCPSLTVGKVPMENPAEGKSRFGTSFFWGFVFGGALKNIPRKRAFARFLAIRNLGVLWSGGWGGGHAVCVK
jgi:hypothetical protein